MGGLKEKWEWRGGRFGFSNAIGTEKRKRGLNRRNDYCRDLERKQMLIKAQKKKVYGKELPEHQGHAKPAELMARIVVVRLLGGFPRPRGK